jgi:predicted amidohydrolase
MVYLFQKSRKGIMLTFALVQFAPVFENKKSSSDEIIKLLHKTDPSVDMIIFPELTLTGFTMRSQKFAEDMEGESVEFFQGIGRQYKAHIFAGMIEKENSDYFNTMLHLDPTGQIVSRYRKIHPFSYSGENRFYRAGTHTVITRVGSCRIGMAICYDLRFPELFRLYAKERVHLIIDIANWPQVRIDHWRSLLKARSIEDQCYVIGVNRVGKDKKNEYCGHSCVFAPFGEEICHGTEKEEVITGSLSLERVHQVQGEYPFLNDIRLI